MVEDRKAKKPVPRIVEDCKTTQCFGCAACWDLNVDIWRATGEVGGDAKGKKYDIPDALKTPRPKSSPHPTPACSRAPGWSPPFP